MFYRLEQPLTFVGKPAPIDLTKYLHNFVRSKTISIDMTFCSISYAYMTLLAVFFKFRPVPDFFISLNRGYLAVGSIKNGQNVLLTAKAAYADGQTHKLQLRGTTDGLSVWVDGQLALQDRELFPYCSYNYVEDAIVGQGVVNDEFSNYFDGQLLELCISEQPLPVQEQPVTAGQPTDLFYQGMDGYENFRIPNLLTTPSGVTVASCDARVDAVGDNPNHILRAVRTSTDSGSSWSKLDLLCDYGGQGIADGAAAIDGALLHNPHTNTLWMLYSHTPGGIGGAASQAGVGFDCKGRKLLWDEGGVEHYVREDGSVCTLQGEETGYWTDCFGRLSKDGEPVGSICHGRQRIFREADTTFLMLMSSQDDGKTWSLPTDLNPMVKQPWMRFLGAGPGTGICLEESAYKGRLVFTVYFSSVDAKAASATAVIYSDDHGKSWTMGASVTDGRVFDGEVLTARYLRHPTAMTGESQVIELPDGRLRIFLRNHLCQYVCTADSADGGASWGQVTVRTDMPDPRCQSHILRVKRDGKDYYLFSNPCHHTKRVHGMVKLSTDGTETWSSTRLIDPGEFWYSCMTELPDGQIGLLYEGRELAQRFVKFPLEWLIG